MEFFEEDDEDRGFEEDLLEGDDEEEDLLEGDDENK
jgi:hypothetical protein